MRANMLHTNMVICDTLRRWQRQKSRHIHKGEVQYVWVRLHQQTNTVKQIVVMITFPTYSGAVCAYVNVNIEYVHTRGTTAPYLTLPLSHSRLHIMSLLSWQSGYTQNVKRLSGHYQIYTIDRICKEPGNLIPRQEKWLSIKLHREMLSQESDGERPKTETDHHLIIFVCYGHEWKSAFAPPAHI